MFEDSSPNNLPEAETSEQTERKKRQRDNVMSLFETFPLSDVELEFLEESPVDISTVEEHGGGS